EWKANSEAAVMATSTQREREEKREPNSQYSSAIIDAEGELQDRVSCVYCGAVNPVERDRCKACGEALGGRSVDRRVLMARSSTYASHMGQSKRSRRARNWWGRTWVGWSQDGPPLPKHQKLNYIINWIILILNG